MVYQLKFYMKIDPIACSGKFNPSNRQNHLGTFMYMYMYVFILIAIIYM
jgi:hypothetical protein